MVGRPRTGISVDFARFSERVPSSRLRSGGGSAGSLRSRTATLDAEVGTHGQLAERPHRAVRSPLFDQLDDRSYESGIGSDGGGPGKGGTGRLLVDDRQVAEARIDRTMGFRISLDETFDIGSDAGEPVSEDYHVPFDFQGTLTKVEVQLEN